MSDDKLLQDEFTTEEVKILTELESKFKRILPLKIRGFGMIVFRKPSRPEWNLYKKGIKDSEKSTMVDSYKAEDAFCKSMICYPSADIYDAVLDDRPALQEIFKQICEGLAQGDGEDLYFVGKDWKKPEEAE